MTAYWFNRNPVVIGPRAESDHALIEGTPNLRRASLSNAVLYGGPLLRGLLQSAPIVGDHKHIFVDTKVSMLMPGWWPAIPGWHTDGVPRYSAADETVTPANWGTPSLPLQNYRSLEGYYPRYHTLHVGNDCPTVFIDGLLYLPIEHDEDEQLYSELTRRIDGCTTLRKLVAQEGIWHSWDWWNIHQASQATERGWRLLIRITESDQPPADSDFIRPQNQVYVPREFGW
ncbi:Uncharacterised protein [Mycobacteroides abscessus subsp. massiliense]|uniref:hypothetical protein n=1 Tax=Mycobacteroides abscessus TaxID=36809 RepID=UPI0009A75DB6|nr:hypothetical protein [Mycobacteroides abscessus]SKU89106.1 Uncharacterised protein [Mycobacteroides abscessus subsp. massiliense]SKU97185.1 Uncharacterised protein [Mycobacteroides abscessus subsp. massiliense]